MSWWDSLTGLLTGSGADTDEGIDWTQLAVSLGGGYLASQSGFNQAQVAPTGYQGGIPEYTAVRSAVPMEYDPNRRPGSGGRRYFSDVRYAAPDSAAAARTATDTQAQGLAALNAASPVTQTRPAPMQAPATPARSPIVSQAPARVIENVPIPQQTSGLSNYMQTYAAGGIAQLAGGKYLNGATDGMADQVPANINGQQEARLSDGEFVIPADVVSHLGNGNSDAGAKELYGMMDRVRKARTGTTKQGKQINPAQYTPR